MKYVLSQLVDFVGEKQVRRNLGALLKYLLFLLAVISVYSWGPMGTAVPVTVTTHVPALAAPSIISELSTVLLPVV